MFRCYGPGRRPGLALHDTVLKRYRVAAGSARPLRDYLPLRDFSIIHDYRLFRDSAMDIATGIARRPDDSAMEIATGIAARPTHRRALTASL